jgi:predicted O-methyltransferase YrrM
MKWLVEIRNKLLGINHIDKVRSDQQYHFKELKAIEVLKPYFPKGYLFESGFSLSFQTIQHIANDIVIFKPSIVLEFGSGLSTIILNNFIKQNGLEVRLISIDNDGLWQRSLREECDRVDFFDFPLRQSHPNSYNAMGSWFDIPDDHHLNTLKYDLVIVDAPKGSLGKLSRYGFIPFIEDKLSKNAVVYIDDTNRIDEQQIAEIWGGKNKATMISEIFNRYTRFTSDQSYYTSPS